MTKIQAIKKIMALDPFIGLPGAVAIYNYLSCCGELVISESDIYGYLEGRLIYD